ncbi:acetyltransferase, GNAT family [Dictyocaulus viviparus]|uniref:Acetyltransferase, GNAT family n=1 Tax=Dictyocaulus viviparus TaxID=29172 RepID=A0A0D8Y434_DICVI|nr:acetyltransferase, GNAT family [Dictyocaulus viviparus]
MFMAEDYSTWMNSFEKFWYYMAIDKDSNEAVGGVCLAFDRSVSGNSDEDLYYVGMYYVRPEWRGSGLGTMLFEKILKIAGNSNTVLNGVMKMTDRYAAKYSFDKMVEYKHNFASISTEKLVIPRIDSQCFIKDLTEVNESDVIAYDAKISHRNRSKYLLNYITVGSCYTKVAVDSKGKIIGIGCLRVTYSNDLCTGPLYADNEAAARSLLAGMLSMVPNLTSHKTFASLYPAINEDATRLFESIGDGHMKIVPFSQCQFTKKICFN